MATKQKVSEEEINRLKAWIEANNYTVYTVLRHVSASGMQREISVVIPIVDEHAQGRYLSLKSAYDEMGYDHCKPETCPKVI